MPVPEQSTTRYGHLFLTDKGGRVNAGSFSEIRTNSLCARISAAELNKKTRIECQAGRKMRQQEGEVLQIKPSGRRSSDENQAVTPGSEVRNTRQDNEYKALNLTEKVTKVPAEAQILVKKRLFKQGN